MAERLVEAGGVRLCVESHGSDRDPAVLLLAGAGQSMVWWEEAFCARLAAAGRRVVRWDARGTGRSTTVPPGGSYAAEDLAADPLRVLDALGVPAAHLVGLSLGGILAQAVAARAPDRVLSLTLVASTPAGPYDGPPLPGPAPQVLASFADPGPAPDWQDREAVVAHRVAVERPYVGGLGLDEARVRRLAALEVDRTPDMAAAMSDEVEVTGDAWPAGARLQDLRVPTLVLHGTDDPLFPLEHGRALARLVPGARLVELDGVGHQQPPPERWDVVLDALVEHTAGR